MAVLFSILLFKMQIMLELSLYYILYKEYVRPMDNNHDLELQKTVVNHNLRTYNNQDENFCLMRQHELSLVYLVQVRWVLCKHCNVGQTSYESPRYNGFFHQPRQ